MATNLDTGLELKLASRNLGSIYKNVLWLHNPFRWSSNPRRSCL